MGVHIHKYTCTCTIFEKLLLLFASFEAQIKTGVKKFSDKAPVKTKFVRELSDWWMQLAVRPLLSDFNPGVASSNSGMDLALWRIFNKKIAFSV